MLQIKTTGVEDYLDGSANIKSLIIGGPGAGKTRSSSYWPSPIFLDCENGRGSLADRNMPYAEIRSSKDMLDALEYLKSLEKKPKAERQFQTVVVDTIDSFQRVVKDEWVQMTRAQTFTGFDAWGYLDTKMAMLLTRLLNLDYNVIVLVHYEDKIIRDGETQTREFKLQLQGKVADQIFNDFGLVGWLGTYWAAGPEGRIQKRGLTFQPTPDKPFLKDRFNCTPKYLEISFTERDYTQLFEAFFNRPEFEALGESQAVGEIPDSERVVAQAGEVAPPSEGGAVASALEPPAPIPLEKLTKPELERKAKIAGVTLRGNMLKAEIIAAIREAEAKQAEPEKPAEEPDEPGPIGDPEPEPEPQPEPQSEPAPDAEPASPAEEPETTTSGGEEQEQAQLLSPEQVQEAFGAEVISTPSDDTPSPQPAPAPSTPVEKPAAPQGPSACADCGTDLGEEWNDPSKRDYIRLSRVKYRKYLCTSCMAKQ